MTVVFKDIELLTQKASVAGTEKLPVSDTEFITPDQIVSGVRKDLDILLKHEDLSVLTVWKRQINSSGDWASYTSSDPDESVILPITPGERYCVVAKDANTFVAPLTSTTPATSGAAPFATGYSSRITVSVGTPFVFDAPNDAAGLYILLVTHSGTQCAPEVYHLTGLAEYLKYKLLDDESEAPANPAPGTLYLIPETS